MKIIPLTRGYEAIIDDCDSEIVAKHNWHARFCGGKHNRVYAANNSGNGGNSKDIYMHRLIMGAAKGDLVDHKNGNSLDNTRSNLRIANRSINTLNAINHRPTVSGFRGVTWHRGMNKWRARVVVNSKEILIGWFSDPIAASQARNYYVSELINSPNTIKRWHE